MTVHPFGATSSPFCANYALKKSVDSFGTGMSNEARRIAGNDIYVDDCITSVKDEIIARSVVKEITNTFRKGGFRMKKWNSNSVVALSEVPTEELAEKMRSLDTYGFEAERTLGVKWDTGADEFVFHFNDIGNPNTRRRLLSCVATIFDPIGLIAPFILTAKILLQTLCKKGIGWDDEMDAGDRQLWENWKESMCRLKKVAIPRCVLREPDCADKQLHIFCDASEVGYGAAAYVRINLGPGAYDSNLLMAKARVAPIKQVTIPRLELSAAVLATRLFNFIRREIDLEWKLVRLWTDSILVLRYLNNTTSRFCTFVANRVQEIHESTLIEQWKHVDSESNPADLASRGMLNSSDGLKFWLKGPSFLKLSQKHWPVQEALSANDSDLELKRNVATYNTLLPGGPLECLIARYSDWTKLVRTIAWWLRYMGYLRTTHDPNRSLQTGIISFDEVTLSEVAILRYVQRTRFCQEYESLSEGQGIINSPIWQHSRLRKLSPIMVGGLLRVGGRLQLAACEEEAKHPIILPSDHATTELLIRFFHTKEGHSGVTQTLSAIRNRYWILQGGATVKRSINKCMICKKHNARMIEQQMAVLPSARVEVGWFPFQYVGVDYFGPFFVKRGRAAEKRYGCLFTCLQCRAIHIELAQTLTTDSFIMAMLRFVNRRGAPKEMFSDNGGNFVGSAAELKGWMSNLNQESINRSLCDHNIRWNFNPPLASHRGGVWERMIRSVRRVIYRTAGRQSMNEEVLGTYLSQAERIVNDRPSTTLREGPEEPVPIRPSDLIQPRSYKLNTIDLSLGELVEKRWRVVNDLTEAFWKRWKSEYLPMLQLRQKWFAPKKELKVGDMVMISSESTSRGVWPLGIVEEVFRDADGLVRTADVKTAKGVLRRDVRKLCFLEAVDIADPK